MSSRAAAILTCASLLVPWIACGDEPSAAGPGGAGGGGAAAGGAFGGAGAGGQGAGVAAGGAGAQGGAPGGGGGGGQEPGADFRVAGPHAVSVTQGSFQTTSGCTLDYDLYAPEGASSSVLVVAAHGLECGREHLAGVAQHQASWGLRVVAPDLCHSTLLDLDQVQNGLDMVELGAALGSGAVLYEGHSAGGLAAFVASANDATALALVGLDPAEWNGIGATVAPGLAVPALGLLGDPSVCNGWNNAVGLYQLAPQGRALKVTEADHCDFSSPNSCTQCQAGCGTGSNDQFSNPQILATILGMSTAALLWQAGIDESGEGWWTAGGSYYQALAGGGAVSEP